MPVILSDNTYQRLMKMLEKWEKGQIIEPGPGLKLLEVGTGYEKLGVDLSNVPLTSLGFGELNLNVCIGGSPVSKIFLTKL